MEYENTWTHQNEHVESIPEGYVGFIYCITNLLDGRRYLGKKKATNTKTTYKMVTQKNGIKKRKKIKTEVESDWKSYVGSNTELQGDVEKYGIEHFKREILYYCKTLGEMSYRETYEIFVNHAVPSNMWYNSWVSVRVRSNHLPKDFMENISCQPVLSTEISKQTP